MSFGSLPTHAYRPGKTARHPEGAFDAIRDTAQAGMAARELAESSAFLTGLLYLEKAFFWEAHEVLEPVWMVLPEGSPERHMVQGLIQLANACLKRDMGKPKAALRLCGIVRGLVTGLEGQVLMGIAVDEILGDVGALERQVAV